MGVGTTGRVKTVGNGDGASETARVRGRTPQPAPVPPERVGLLRSIRRWLLAVAFLLGAGLATLAHVGYVASGYADGPVFAVAGTAGGTVAVVAAVYWLGSVTRPIDADGGGREGGPAVDQAVADDVDGTDPGEPNA
jgi:hypothetical protein